ncbi:trypsin inhibitor-like [Dendropsophus ebraccatus]|uniref:trypsin inhibitor-like n=1 Tax=Dendropsophus ebraccatus TaxID=150705 RepID=UPI003831BA35
MKTSAVLLVLAACFLLISQAIPADRCQFPEDKGPCEAFMPRYFYDAERKKCNRFIYGGCQGNDNNFKTLEECEQACLED